MESEHINAGQELFLDGQETLVGAWKKTLEKNPEKMPNIFFKMFNNSSNTVIKFLSNKSNFFEDLKIILKMPKWTFIKALFY